MHFSRYGWNQMYISNDEYLEEIKLYWGSKDCKGWNHSKHLHKGEKQSRRSKARVLKNGEAPQCSCTIEECTNMESLLPQNHLEHSPSARVERNKAKQSTCTRDVVEP